MNGRIRELADQAKQYCFEQSQKRLDPEEYMPYSDMYDKKFAELIIQECAEFVRYKAEKAMSQEILYVGNDLLTHFGVE